MAKSRAKKKREHLLLVMADATFLLSGGSTPSFSTYERMAKSKKRDIE
ncbi:hypothetical protein MOF34_16015 [Bacillus sp. T17B1]|nr:hypothetical protein [Bacillus sp. T17B1]